MGWVLDRWLGTRPWGTIAKPRRASPEFDRTLVIAHQDAARPAHTQAGRNGIQRALVERDKNLQRGWRQSRPGTFNVTHDAPVRPQSMLPRRSQSVDNK